MERTELARRLRATTMFSPLPMPRLLALIEGAPLARAAPGDWLDGAPGGLRDHLVLLTGEVEARRCWTSADGREVSHARRVAVAADGPGFALVGASGSQLRVRALTDTDYLTIDSYALDDLLGWTHLGAFVLPEPHLKLFHRLPLENVAQAIRRMVERKVASGEAIVTQGEPGDEYYTLLAGEAEVWEADPQTGHSILVNRLVDGDGFGEEALLADGVRTATVRMTTPGSLLVLRKADFDVLLRPPMVKEVDAARARDMVADGRARLLDCRHPAEFGESRIPGARLAPLDRLRHEAVFDLEPDLPHVVYCRTGRRSRAAAFLLHERGIRALSLRGGIAEWPYELDNGPP